MKLSGLTVFILIAMLVTCSGCFLCGGGKTVNALGTGTTIPTSRLVQQPNGIFKLEPIEIKPPESKPVKIDPIRSRPIIPEPISAKPTPIKPKMNVIPAGELPPKDPPKIIISELPTMTNQIGELPIIIDNNGNEYNLTPAEEAPKMKVNWMELFEFYLWAMLFLALMYFGWKAARKKTENMIKEERSKKAPAPKKTAKKTAKKSKKKTTKTKR